MRVNTENFESTVKVKISSCMIFNDFDFLLPVNIIPTPLVDWLVVGSTTWLLHEPPFLLLYCQTSIHFMCEISPTVQLFLFVAW